jgi:hypothetical protein
MNAGPVAAYDHPRCPIGSPLPSSGDVMPTPAADPGAGSLCAVAAGDDAEAGPAGVGEDPEASFAFTLGMGGAQGTQFVLGPVGVDHGDAQVHLLGCARSG